MLLTKESSPNIATNIKGIRANQLISIPPKIIIQNQHLGQSIQEWTNSNLWKINFKKTEGIWSA